MALLTLGGALKRKEMLSARFGDILSELYLSSAALKRWKDEGRQQDDFPLLEWCMEASFATIEARFDEILANFPVRPVGVAAAIPDPAVRPAPARPVRPRHRSLRRPHPRAVGGARPADRRICFIRRRTKPTTASRGWNAPSPDGRGAADPRPHARRARARRRAGGEAGHHHRRRGRASSRPRPRRSRRPSRSTISRRKN